MTGPLMEPLGRGLLRPELFMGIVSCVFRSIVNTHWTNPLRGRS
jgi:hypothetical protein